MAEADYLTTSSFFYFNTSIHDASLSSVDKNASMEAAVSGLKAWETWYRPVHGYLAPIVCIFGVVANALNLFVLTRKNMLSPTNVILSGLAVSDGLTMAVYFPYAILNYNVYNTQSSPKSYVRFLLFYAIFSVIVHSISIWLTVSLAIFRYIFIRYPITGAKLCSVPRAKLTIAIVTLAICIICIPNGFVYEFQPYTLEDNSTSWYIGVKEITPVDRFVKNLNFWTQALLVKLLPCFFLTILSVCLVRTMNVAEKRRKKLVSRKVNEAKRDGKTNRTTRMLLAVVVLFLLTEIPQGILQLLSGLIDGFFNDVYSPLGDLMDILALINSGINFVLYCSMSKQFRETFVKIVLKDVMKRKRNRTPLAVTQSTQDTDL